MRRVRFVRFSVLAGLAGLAVLSTLQASPDPAPAPADPQLASSWVPPNPTNAAKVFKWGNKEWGDEFVDPLSSTWKVNHASMVRNQHGMLTLDAPAKPTDVIAAYSGHSRTYGRWEARVRGRQYGTSGTPYTVRWELIPSSGSNHCGAANIVLSQYALGTNRAATHVRTLPDNDFTVSKALQLSDNEFHTFAVEVTPDHVSWFVDTKVIRTETRPAARSGVAYTPRFVLKAVPGATMNKGRMQMDWMRYYTLERKNAKSITAPALTQTTFPTAC